MISIDIHFLMILFIIFLIFMLGFLFGMCFIADKEENYKLKLKGLKEASKKDVLDLITKVQESEVKNDR